MIQFALLFELQFSVFSRAHKTTFTQLSSLDGFQILGAERDRVYTKPGTII